MPVKDAAQGTLATERLMSKAICSDQQKGPPLSKLQVLSHFFKK